jgi:hypothetical protein
LKATIPQTRIAKVSVQQVDIGQLSAGPLSVRKLVLDTVHVGMSTGTARLRNLRVSISLRMTLDWEVSVSIPWVGNFGWSGTIDLGTQSATVPLGNVTLPGLQNLTLDLGTVSVNNVNAVIGAIHNLRLGGLVVEQVRANNMVVPTPGFTLTGMGLSKAELAGVSVPVASATDSTVHHIHGQALPLGAVTIPGLALPQANVGDISSQAMDVNATSNPFVFRADAGVLKVSLNLTPGARMQTDELRLTGVRAAISVGSLELQDVVMPYDVLDVKLSDLGIDTIDVPKIEVS